MKALPLLTIGMCFGFAASSVGGLRVVAQDAQAGAAAAVPGDAVPGHILKQVAPVYPPAAAGQADSDVVMNVTITAQGKVTNVKVTQGSPQLIQSAVHAVSQWEYEPQRVNGVATPVDTTIVVHFKGSKGAQKTNAPAQADLSGPSAPVAKPLLPPVPQGVLRISRRVMDGLLETRVEPVYPADAIALDARGQVLLLTTVDKTGDVIDVQVVSGPKRFRDAAVTAVKQWHYRPYLVEGEGAVVQTTMMLDFAPPH